jgi:small subunit ribosomal protein S9
MTAIHYYYGTGRRKSAVARVRVYIGPGISKINEKEVELSPVTQAAFSIIGKEGAYHLSAHVRGGGKVSQLEAIRGGSARALIELNPEYRSVLRAAGFLTSDSRVKERKKPGLKRARRAPQWAKR